MTRRELGASGEDAVAAWYEARGYQIVARNWRSGREGEIDIIAAKGSTLVVCEVKTRSSTAFGSPLEAVGFQKQRRIRRLAARWLAEQGSTGRRHRGEIRFDVAAVLAGEIDVVEGCF